MERDVEHTGTLQRLTALQNQLEKEILINLSIDRNWQIYIHRTKIFKGDLL